MQVGKFDRFHMTSNKRRQFNVISLLLIVLFATYTYASNITLNSSEDVEFGQGSIETVTCDTYIRAKLSSEIDPATGIFYIKQLILSDLSLRLHDRTVSIELLDANDSVLNSNMSFSVAADGLTFTSTRAHVDILDAFTQGLGANAQAEMGSNQITFTSLDTEENPPIPSNSVANVTLQTSGNGNCTVPTGIKAVNVYVDAPYVQGSYIPELHPAVSLVDTYNSVTQSFSACPGNGTVGTYSGNCFVLLRTQDNSRYPWGGAIATSSTPTTGASPGISVVSQSPSAAVYNSSGLTITFETRKNYIGFWWSAGSYGNSIRFYRGAELVATITGDDVYTDIPNTSSTLLALNGTTNYVKSNYYGHPLGTSNVSGGAGEPYVYFHCFAVNGFNFDSIRLATTGNGFEYDNLTVANLGGSQLSPKNTLVFIRGYDYSGS